MLVEEGTPCSDQNANMTQVVELVFTQTFALDPKVEAFNKAILRWLPRRDVMPVNLAIFLPFWDFIRGTVPCSGH